jgi:hypothetical protein
MRKLSIVLLTFFVYSCSSSLNVQESFRSENIDFKHIRNSKITIYGVNSISLSEFEHNTNYEYSDTAKLNNKIVTTVCDQFKNLIPSVTPVEISETIPSFFNPEFSFKNNRSEEASAFFNNLGTEYLIFVDKINAVKTQLNYTFTTRSGALVTSNEELCELNIEVELWDVIQQERIMKFNAAGEETVTHHSYIAALDGAIEKSVNTAVMYIKNDGEL